MYLTKEELSILQGLKNNQTFAEMIHFVKSTEWLIDWS